MALVIAACSAIYPINSGTYYGYYSKDTVAIFICPVVVLLLECIVYGFLTIPSLVKNKELWKTISKNAPIILMVLFLIWTFISCMLAPGAADDVIGSEAAEKIGASPKEVLSKTLNGCYNLKDGYWAFLMYGTVLITAMFLGKDRFKEKKLLIKSFVCVMALLSALTIGITQNAQKVSKEYESYYDDYEAKNATYQELINKGILEDGKTYSKDYFTKLGKSEANKIYTKSYIFSARSIFRNSNHFAYVLCIAVTASLILAVTERKLWERILFVITFGINLYMLIVNDTFGGYLGVSISFALFFIYYACNIANIAIAFKKGKATKESYVQVMIGFGVLILCSVIFISASSNITNSKNEVIVTKNINSFANDFSVLSGFVSKDEESGNSSEENVEVSKTDDDREASGLETVVAKTGSGRGRVWIKVLDLVKQRPLFGYGLECLLFQFSGQFSIGEGRTHNLLLQLLGTVGIPGTIFYFLALAIIAVRLIKNWKTWDDVERICFFVAISYLITALTGNSAYYSSPYFMMFLGFIVLVPWKREENSKEKIEINVKEKVKSK